MAGADEVCGQNLAGHAQFSRDPQSQFIVTAALVASATVFLLATEEIYLVGLTTVTLPPKLRSLLWNAA